MSLSFHQRGDGPALLLIHGIGGSWEMWEPVLDLLAAKRRVLAIDLPGFGASPTLPAETRPTLSALAAAVANWMALEGFDRPHIAGNSLGGAVALELAAGGRSASVTALSPIGFGGRLAFAYGAASLRLTHAGARAITPIAPRLLGNPVGRTLLLSQVQARPWRMTGEAAIRQSRRLVAAPAFEPVMKEARIYRFVGPAPRVPTTIAWGRRDRLLLPYQARRARRLLPEARFVSLSGCGHVPMADDPELVAEVLLEGSDDERRGKSGSL